MMRRIAGFMIACGFSGTALAHPLAPALLQLRETTPQVYEATWRTSVTRVQSADVEPVLPPNCREIAPLQRVPAENESLTARWTVDCGPSGLVGQTLRIRGLERSAINVILRIVPREGASIETLLAPNQPDFVVPRASAAKAVFPQYLALGVEHLFTGVDHLLFILGLLLLVPQLRALFWTVTAFTLGHSVTLALSTLELIRVPQALAEWGIAMTIFVLACELARPPQATWMRRRPWTMAALFGLVHGLGFAGALRDVGLPARDIPLSLLGFNLGIEIAQLLLIAAALSLTALLRRVRLPALAWHGVGIHLIGGLSAYWCLDRGLQMLF